jgi:hypothetical protein
LNAAPAGCARSDGHALWQDGSGNRAGGRLHAAGGLPVGDGFVELDAVDAEFQSLVEPVVQPLVESIELGRQPQYLSVAQFRLFGQPKQFQQLQ